MLDPISPFALHNNVKVCAASSCKHLLGKILQSANHPLCLVNNGVHSFVYGSFDYGSALT